MQHDRGKKSPPCAIQDSIALHPADGFQVHSTQAVQPMNGYEHKAPNKRTPVKNDRRPRQLLPPAPTGVFDLVLSERCHCTLEVLRSDQQCPTVFQVFDHALDALAQQHKTPVHRLAPATGGNDGADRFCACHAESVLLLELSTRCRRKLCLLL